MARLGPVAGDREALVARGDQLDRTVQPARRDRDQRGALGQRAARAEGAADEGRNDMYFLGVDAELLGEAVLEAGDVLAPLPHRQLAVGPGAAGGEQLDRIVVLGRRRVMLVELDRRGGEGRVGVADRRVLIALRDILGGDRFRAWAVEPGSGLLPRIA